MSKRSDPAAFARAAGAADSATPDGPRPEPEHANALAVPPALTETDEPEPEPIPYDPADYRWVPVRRKPRLDGWTEEKQRRFIETLADTGLVSVAAKAVGMSREGAYALRRAEHGGAFARAWDVAREHAAGLIEDIVFDRAIEGTEREVLNREGDVIATQLVHDNGLLKWLLAHLKPERYGGARSRGAAPNGSDAPIPLLAESLRAMEPALPAPAEALLDPDTLAHELLLAEIADGKLPHFFNEQRRPKSDAQLAAEEAAARDARGAAAWEKRGKGATLSAEEFADVCYHLDPVENARPPCRRRR